jgi:molecular chaperone DnaK
MGKIIGIDFGTTNSRVAVMKNGIPVIIPNEKGQNFTPSVVSITEKGEITVGEDAKKTAGSDFYYTVSSVKRKLGTNDWICVGGVTYGPQQIAAMIIRKLKTDAEKYLGEEVTDAVITVPVCFDEIQRQAVRDAGKIAGLNVRRLINDTSAAALYYSLYNIMPEQKIMIVDVGGGAFSVSVLEIDDGVVEVLSADGDIIGGNDFDKRISDYIVDYYKQKEGITFSNSKAEMMRINEAARKAKDDLSSNSPVNIKIPNLKDSTYDNIHHDKLSKALSSGMFDFVSAAEYLNNSKMLNLSVNNFEALTDDLTVKIKETVAKTLSAARVSAKRLDKIFIIGGASGIRSIYDAITIATGKEPDEMTNADRCVALGAAIQGAVLEKNKAVSNMILLDLAPYSLMVRTSDGKIKRIIDKNSTLPLKKSIDFSTTYDDQTTVEVSIYQGESSCYESNRFLGKYGLSRIKPLKKGIPKIKAGIEIDANGIINLILESISDEVQRKVNISSLIGMSEAGIEKAAKDLADMSAASKKIKHHELIIEGKEIEKILKEETDKGVQKGVSSRRLKNKITEDQTDIKEIKAAANITDITNSIEVKNTADPSVSSDITDANGVQDIKIPMRPKFCAYCGNPLPKEEKARFCMFCGERIQNPDESEPENNSGEGEPKNDSDIIFSEGKCAVCGNDVSDTDSVCPKCGFPVISITGKYGTEEIESIKALVIEYRSKLFDK